MSSRIIRVSAPFTTKRQNLTSPLAAEAISSADTHGALFGALRSRHNSDATATRAACRPPEGVRTTPFSCARRDFQNGCLDACGIGQHETKRCKILATAAEDAAAAAAAAPTDAPAIPIPTPDKTRLGLVGFVLLDNVVRARRGGVSRARSVFGGQRDTHWRLPRRSAPLRRLPRHAPSRGMRQAAACANVPRPPALPPCAPTSLNNCE